MRNTSGKCAKLGLDGPGGNGRPSLVARLPLPAAEARTPHKSPAPPTGHLASPPVPTAATATITAAAPAAIADSIIHPIVPEKTYLSPFDPPNSPPLPRRQTARKPGSVPPGTGRGWPF